MLTRVTSHGSRLASCLSLTVPTQGEARVTFALPENTTVVKGRLHLLPSEDDHQSAKLRWNEDIMANAVFGAKSVAIHRNFQLSPPQDTHTVHFDFRSQRQARVCLEAAAIK